MSAVRTTYLRTTRARTTAGLVIAFLASVGAPRQSGAQEAQPTRGRQISAALNLHESNATIAGFMFIPETAQRLSCLVVLMRQSDLDEEFYYDEGLRKAAADASCGVTMVMLSNIVPSAGIAQRLRRDAAVGGGGAVLQLVERFAADSGHKEVANAPMLFWGFSASASFGTTFAALHPERTIGFVRYHTHRRGLITSVDAIKSIPALFVAGGKDDVAGVEDAEAFWRAGQEVGAPWTFAVEPLAPHYPSDIAPTARDLTVPWIAAVLKLRVGQQGNLVSVTNTNGWLGDPRTFDIFPSAAFAGERKGATWLPDSDVARGWQVVGRRKE